MTPPPDDPPPPLLLTGERTVPGVPDENYWFQRHVAAYDHVAGRVSGTVLDAGCGEGYGLPILHAAGARGVIGVDVDPVTADHARARYGHDGVPEVDVVEADLDDLPLVDDTLDAVVCLQVVEHLADPVTALAELVRVGRPGAHLVVSTPNRVTFSPAGPPRNPFHVREFDLAELVDLLEAAGAIVDQVLGVHHGRDLAERLAASGLVPAGDHGSGRPRAGADHVGRLADPATWDTTMREVVHRVGAEDFTILSGDQRPLDDALDLLAWARVPG
jgi:SAM-dependent methyltransferase